MIDWILYAVLIVLQFLDVHSTNKVIEQGGYEVNPFIAKLMQITGRFWGPLKIVFVVAIGLTLVSTTHAAGTYVLAAGVLIYAWVVWHNYRLTS